jgi:hypothetical protein
LITRTSPDSALKLKCYIGLIRNKRLAVENRQLGS